MTRMVAVGVYLTPDEHRELVGMVRDGEYPSIAEVIRQSIWHLAADRGLSFAARERTRRGRPVGYRHRPETIEKMRASALRQASDRKR